MNNEQNKLQISGSDVLQKATPKIGEALHNEAIKRENTRRLDLRRLAEMGFLRIVGEATYQAVEGMKVNIKEVSAIA